MSGPGTAAAKLNDIPVVIVNYNTADLTTLAIESVLSADHGSRKIHVHVVDNASPNGDAQTLQRHIAEAGWSQHVTLYPETKNHGFGLGNNVVLERLLKHKPQPDAVFFLNPDARLANNAIAILAEFLEQHDTAVVAGARVENTVGQPVTAAFRFHNLPYLFAHALSFGPVSRRLSGWNVPLPPDTQTRQVDWVSGAAFMARFDRLKQTGFFDPEFFLYFEEVDLMRRAGAGAADIWHVAEARVIHAEGAATGVGSDARKRKRRPSYWYHSWYYYTMKHHGRAYALVAMSTWMAGAAVNIAMSKLRGKLPDAPLGLFGDLWAMAGRPLIGLKARPYD